ncbi:MAG: hypothetical protein LBK46_05135 [Oscillospiraceae bacterium]|jgi:hypothetical protein|nr:hypothetical protein [Oscillospiraceae bacterium]
MRTIYAVWGTGQTELYTLGTLADAGDAQIRIDLSLAQEMLTGATYSIKLRRADGVEYMGATGLSADADNALEYVLQQQDLSAPGALWITVTAQSGEATFTWKFIGWVYNAAYDGGYGSAGPLWVQALLAMVEASNATYNVTINQGG